MRRGAVFSLLAIGLVAAGLTTLVALYVPWLPPQASEERKGIDFVFWFTAAICIGIFAVVAAVSIYAGIKFRVRDDDDSDGPPIHGHTGLEIAWTAVPAVLVTAIAIVSAVVLARNDRASGGQSPLRVNVTGQQFAWMFSYPEADDVASGNLRLPVDRSAELHLTARDVIHSFWVPEFGQKQDAVPGIDTKIIVTPTKIGEYRVVCTELCGLGHATMRTRAIVMSQQDFDAWLTRTRTAVGGAGSGGGGDQAGQTVFAEQGCGSCHALSAAKSTGSQGPDLDNLPQYARRAGQPLEQFIRQSLVNPNAYVEKNFPRGVMPPYSSLPKEQLDALVEFLVTSSKGAGS